MASRGSGGSICQRHRSQMKKRRVIIFLESFKMGGAERQAMLLAKGLKYDYDFHFMAADDDGELIHFCQKEGFPYSSVSIERYGGKGTRLADAFRVLSAFMRLRPAVIIPFTYFPNLYANMVWRLTGAKICLWNQRDEGRLIMGGILERFALKQASNIISNSVIGADFLKSKFPFIDHVQLIQNAVVQEEPIFTPAHWRAQLGLEDQAFIAVMVANVHQFKDHDTLIRAWALFKTDHDEASAKLLIVGEDYGLGQKLKALSHSLSIEEDVVFLGRQQDIPGLLTTCDLGILSTKKEGMPNAILEYLIFGLPVVATDLPDIRLLLEGTESAVVRGGDVQALGVAIATFYLNWLKDSSKFDLNRDKATKCYSAEAMVSKYRQIFDL